MNEEEARDLLLKHLLPLVKDDERAVKFLIAVAPALIESFNEGIYDAMGEASSVTAESMAYGP